jgi:hypothetical protein
MEQAVRQSESAQTNSAFGDVFENSADFEELADY